MKEQQRERPPPGKEAGNGERQRLYKQRLDKLLDEALEGTFPASDPIALTPRRPMRRS